MSDSLQQGRVRTRDLVSPTATTTDFPVFRGVAEVVEEADQLDFFAVVPAAFRGLRIAVKWASRSIFRLVWLFTVAVAAVIALTAIF